MNCFVRSFLVTSVLLLATFLGAHRTSASVTLVDGAAKVGDRVADFPFGETTGDDARERLSQHLGQCVLLVEWQDIGFGGMDAARAAVKLEQQYGDALVVYLVDVNPDWSRSKSQAFLHKTFPGYGPRIMSKVTMPVVEEGDQTPPRIVLIGVDGTLLVEGSHRVKGGKIAKLVAAEIAKRKSGWGTDATAKKMRALMFGEGKLAAARQLGRDAKNKSAEIEAALGEVEALFKRHVERAAELVRQGRYCDSGKCLEVAMKGSTGVAEWDEMLAYSKSALDEFATAEKRSAEKELNAIASKLATGKAEAAVAKRAREIAEKHPNTELSKRAAYLAEVAEHEAR